MSVEAIATGPDTATGGTGPRLGWRGRTEWRGWLSFLVLFALWQAASRYQWVDPKFLPGPAAVALRAWTELTAGSLAADIAASLRRNLTGFGIGATAGLVLGFGLGISETVSRVVGPTLIAQRQTALFAWVPLLSMWFGGGDAGKIAFITVAAFQPTLINTWLGVRQIPRGYRELSEALLFGRLDYIRLVALPGALPAIFTGLQGGLIYAWLATVGSEIFLNITPGLGGRLSEGSQLFEMDLLFVTIFILGTIGLLYSQVAIRLEAILIRGRTR